MSQILMFIGVLAIVHASEKFWFETIKPMFTNKPLPEPFVFVEPAQKYYLPLTDSDRFYIQFKEAISNIERREELVAMEIMINDFALIFGSTQQYIYLQAQLKEKADEVLYNKSK